MKPNKSYLRFLRRSDQKILASKVGDFSGDMKSGSEVLDAFGGEQRCRCYSVERNGAFHGWCVRTGVFGQVPYAFQQSKTSRRLPRGSLQADHCVAGTKAGLGWEQVAARTMADQTDCQNAA